MKNTVANLVRRYPGLKPFERGQTAVFHGRKKDVHDLANLVIRERLVVLFAKSGIGKTSLLQAGCAPELEAQDFAPIFLRVDRINDPILETVGGMLVKSPCLRETDLSDLRPDSAQTLWEKMKRLEFDLDGFPATPVLVFDQFEEAFTLSHSTESRNQFFSELADLANETMPESLRIKLLMQFEKGEISLTDMQWWEQQPDVRIILSIRSDFLHLLDRASKRIPGILRNRYELLPLDRDKALSAIVKPAAQAGEFASQAFLFAGPALEEILDFLAGRNATEDDGQMPTKTDEIEAVNLQIICQGVEERIIDHKKPTGFEVNSQFYEHKEGLRNSIRNFYENQLNAFPKAYQERILQKKEQGSAISSLDQSLTEKPLEVLRHTAQLLIEESLITPGNRRNSVVDDTLLSEYQITPDFLDTLVDKSRLLRKEPRLDDFYYEIGHDTLLPAIIEFRSTRRENENAAREKADYEAKLAEEATQRKILEAELVIARNKTVESELNASNKSRKFARILAVLSFVSLLISTGFVIWFINEYVDNARQQLTQAEFYVHNELYDAADHAYTELIASPRKYWLLEKTKPHKNILTEYELAKLFHKAYNAVDSNFVFADSLMLVNNFAPALKCYRLAEDSLKVYRALNDKFSNDTLRSDWRVRPQLLEKRAGLIQHRISNARQALAREFKISQLQYKSFVEAKAWGQALRHLRRMEQLLPVHPSDESDLQREMEMQELPSEYVKRERLRCEAKRGL